MSRRLFALAVEAGAAAAIDPVVSLWSRDGGGAQLAYSRGGAVQHMRRRWSLPDAVAMVDLPDAETLKAGLDAYRPDVIIASATRSPLEAAALGWAREHGVGMLQIVDTWANLEGRFPTGAPDRIGVIDQLAYKRAIAAGFDADRLIVVGQPAWEGLPPAPPAPSGTMLFVGQPVMKAWGRELGYTEIDAFNICLGARRASSGVTELAYLRHPAEVDAPHLAEADAVSSDPKSAVDQHGIICGMFSSLSVEALLRGRHVITLLPEGATRRLCHLGEQGLTPVVSTAEALLQQLSAPPRLEGVAGLKASLEGSTQRTLDAVLVLMERSTQ